MPETYAQKTDVIPAAATGGKREATFSMTAPDQPQVTQPVLPNSSLSG